MNKEHLKIIKSEFSELYFERVVSEMSSLTLNHVMIHSQTNLDNTLSAILKLSNGEIGKLVSLVNAAKTDFRDVIYWASLEKNN